MYRLKPGIKRDPERRWALPDRVFFGHGACHILAGVYLQVSPLPGFRAERIIPNGAFGGNHVYVTDGIIAFDYHGYVSRGALLRHHLKSWSEACGSNWGHTLETVDFDLLSTAELNQRKMLGPDEYFKDPIPRAYAFIRRIEHGKRAKKAQENLRSRDRLPAKSLGCGPFRRTGPH